MVHTSRPFTTWQRLLSAIATLMLIVLLVGLTARLLGQAIWSAAGFPQPTIVFNAGYKVLVGNRPFIVSGTSFCPNAAVGIATYGPPRISNTSDCVVMRPTDAKVLVVLHGDGGATTREWVTVLHRPRRAGEDPRVVQLRTADGSIIAPAS